MSFWKRLFGGSSQSEDAPASGAAVEYNGFTIRPTPFKQDGQYQCCGIVSKEIGGATKEHRFIRADRFASLDDAIDISVRKGRQLVDEQGDRIFQS